MPQMRPRVLFIHPIIYPPLPQAAPTKDMVIMWWCPACAGVGFKLGMKQLYDGRFPHPDCPDCKAREEAGQVAMTSDEAEARVV